MWLEWRDQELKWEEIRAESGYMQSVQSLVGHREDLDFYSERNGNH